MQAYHKSWNIPASRRTELLNKFGVDKTSKEQSMNRLKYILISALAAVIGTTVTSRRVQAQGPDAVRVVNTPLPTQDSFQLASNLVEITCPSTGYLVFYTCAARQPNGRLLLGYKVPSGSYLVITSVDIIPDRPLGGLIIDTALYNSSGVDLRAEWKVSNGSTTVLQYPSGIVLPPGYIPTMENGGTQSATVVLRGYLSPYTLIPFTGSL